ncbi:hypothetical protein [Natrarchaeobius chitinivorans]|uniref:Uncharacterized protein n=1 Tax=Natrarchaeobius chitinivorans TaxID=1679083 RepID=A0A3N6P5E7_NATCH|nr:hypothetical protein [Natrarchaeobius chitinivorans]RQG90785.1 hypothetical protein EA473_20260 [Natrarchaeobius chitinivorans]
MAGTGSSTATVTRWSRALVGVGVGFFVVWQLAVLAGYPRSATVTLGVYGFVFHVVFGKAYGLVPSYFARELAFPYAPAVHLPLSSLGTFGAFADVAGMAPPVVGVAGTGLWLAGCLLFVGTLGWTIRGNPTGGETGTGSVDSHRVRVDRAANAAVPIVFLYLLAGSTLAFLEALGRGPAIPPAASSHLLAAGAAALLVFAIGFRLLPRLLVVSPRPALVAVVLPAGAVGPALLVADFGGGWPFRIGAAALALALVGFAATYADLYRRSERRRTGGWVLLAAAGFAAAVAVLGVSFAAGLTSGAAFDAHYRLAVGGFLGLTIVGVTYHFYPPAVASSAFVDDRTAAVSALGLICGLILEAAGLLAGITPVTTVGGVLSVLGASGYALVILAVFRERPV